MKNSNLANIIHKSMKKCLVLLCTYNGEKYLPELIDSILHQKHVDVEIVAADDCSTDNTQNILKKYSKKYSNFSYSVNKANKKFTYNFLDLFFSVKDKEFDYVAFADQDDVWLDNKLMIAIHKIEEEGKTKHGCLYSSNLIVANDKLEKIGMQEDETVITKTNKCTYLFENIATGCTMVMDKKFYDHATRYYPENINLHDYWLFMIAIYTANYVYDYNGYILYRQHGDNQIGTNKKKWTMKNIKKVMKSKNGQDHTAGELLNGFEEFIYEENFQDLILIRDYKKKFKYKWKLMWNKKYRKRNHNLILKLKFLLNKV